MWYLKSTGGRLKRWVGAQGCFLPLQKTEDMGSVLSTNIWQLTTTTNSSPRGSDALFCPPGASACTQCAYIPSDKHAHAHTLKIT